MMRDLLLALLGMQGHEVDAVESGDEALHRLTTSPQPDFILTDMLMPGLHGDALVQALRGAMGPSARLVGMSGSRPQQRVLDSLDAFMLKPFGYADLEAALQSVAAPQAVAAAGQAVPETAGTGPQDGSAVSAASATFADGKANRMPGTGPVLDEAIFASLGESFRPVQLAELYTMTLNDVELRRDRMAGYAAAGDAEATQREAHSIKGLCGMVGARELSDLAGAVEAGTASDVFDLDAISAACARLRRMLDTKFANQIAPAGEHE